MGGVCRRGKDCDFDELVVCPEGDFRAVVIPDDAAGLFIPLTLVDDFLGAATLDEGVKLADEGDVTADQARGSQNRASTPQTPNGALIPTRS